MAAPTKEARVSLAIDSPAAPTVGDNTIVESVATAVINAPFERVDLPAWCYTLSDAEYQACSPAHYGAGASTAADGRRMSLNVEIIGGSVMVQHYVEEIGEPHHLKLVSHSDLFTPTGRTKIGVVWEMSVARRDDESCELTNRVRSSAPPELLEFLATQGLAFEPFRAARRPNSEAHNRQETPFFAKSIERHALGSPDG
jgi:hypothetical protein